MFSNSPLARDPKKAFDNLKHNPIVFDSLAESFVLRAQRIKVGAWLATVSASIFAIVIIGGHTRLTKSGLSMVRWEPHRVLPPMNAKEW